MIEIKRHVYISIGCPNVEHGHTDFRVENGKHICNHCEQDFTKEMIELADGIMKSVEQETKN